MSYDNTLVHVFTTSETVTATRDVPGNPAPPTGKRKLIAVSEIQTVASIAVKVREFNPGVLLDNPILNPKRLRLEAPVEAELTLLALLRVDLSSSILAVMLPTRIPVVKTIDAVLNLSTVARPKMEESDIHTVLAHEDFSARAFDVLKLSPIKFPTRVRVRAPVTGMLDHTRAPKSMISVEIAFDIVDSFSKTVMATGRQEYNIRPALQFRDVSDFQKVS